MAVRRLIATLLLLPVLAACSDDEPGSSGSGDPTTPATSDPTPTETPPPTEPPEAGEKTEAGAKAFVEYWIQALNFAMRTGDTSVLDELSTATCSSCDSMRKTIEDIYTSGGEIRSVGWKLDRFSGIEMADGGTYRVGVVLDLPSEVVLRADEEPERHPELQDAIASLTLIWDQSDWRIARFARSAS